MDNKWKDKTLLQKAGLIIAILGAVGVLISAIKPDLFAVDTTIPSIAIMTIGEAMDYWPNRRKWALAFIIAAVICMAFFIVELCLL